MKKNWTLLVGSLLLSTLALSACSKKGDSGAATPPGPGANGGPTQPGVPVQSNRGQWSGPVQVVDRSLLKQLLRQTYKCNDSCRFEGLYLRLALKENQLPGQGTFLIRAFDYSQWNNAVHWKYTLGKQSYAIPLNNGFQFNYNVNGGGWHGGGPWLPPGQEVCYWREVPRKGTKWWAQLQLSGQDGSLQLGASNSSPRLQYVCEGGMHTMQAQSQEMGPQVVDPSGAQSMQSEFWAGNQVQIVAEYKDASKTCLVVKIYFKGQLAAQGEIAGFVYP